MKKKTSARERAKRAWARTPSLRAEDLPIVAEARLADLHVEGPNIRIRATVTQRRLTREELDAALEHCRAELERILFGRPSSVSERTHDGDPDRATRDDPSGDD